MALLFVAISVSNAAAEDPPTFVLAWGSYASPFSTVGGVAVDPAGFVWVPGNPIKLFRSDGTPYADYGGDTGLDNPHSLAISGDTAYVADTNHSRIAVYIRGFYGPYDRWGARGSGEGEFDHPWGIATDGRGSVYVADTGNHRIQKFTSKGKLVTLWGRLGSSPGEFTLPCGIAIGPSGDVCVADRGNSRIQKFSSAGNFLTTWGGLGTAAGAFDLPVGVAIDHNENVYVADTMNHRIQKFTGDGVFLSSWGSPGAQNGQFFAPAGVAVTAGGAVFVVDSGNLRIQKFAYKTPIRAVSWGLLKAMWRTRQ